MEHLFSYEGDLDDGGAVMSRWSLVHWSSFIGRERRWRSLAERELRNGSSECEDRRNAAAVPVVRSGLKFGTMGKSGTAASDLAEVLGSCFDEGEGSRERVEEMSKSLVEC